VVEAAIGSSCCHPSGSWSSRRPRPSTAWPDQHQTTPDTRPPGFRRLLSPSPTSRTAFRRCR